jgi:hypothetical protein
MSVVFRGGGRGIFPNMSSKKKVNKKKPHWFQSIPLYPLLPCQYIYFFVPIPLIQPPFFFPTGEKIDPCCYAIAK